MPTPPPSRPVGKASALSPQAQLLAQFISRDMSSRDIAEWEAIVQSSPDDGELQAAIRVAAFEKDNVAALRYVAQHGRKMRSGTG